MNNNQRTFYILFHIYIVLMAKFLIKLYLKLILIKLAHIFLIQMKKGSNTISHRENKK